MALKTTLARARARVFRPTTYNIDARPIAAQTGTSCHMMEQAYFKFIPSATREKLAVVRDSSHAI
ncbi:MAG TPA: hypothetical protein VGM84_10300 [Steroidobacteraceae bacterium]|jgi:hypothetical protein